MHRSVLLQTTSGCHGQFATIDGKAQSPKALVVGEHLGLAGKPPATERGSESVGFYRRALRLRPLSAEAHVDLAIALQVSGQAAEAMRAVERALALDPNFARAWVIRSDLKSFTDGDVDIDQMERLLSRAEMLGLSDQARQDLGFALGKAWMDISDGDRAFTHLNAANRLKRATFTYDVEADVARLEAIGAGFTPDLMRRFSGAGDPSDQPIFVVGMPRSGTTLVEQILASHPEIHGAGEITALRDAVGSVLPLNLFRTSGLSASILNAMGRAYVARIGPAARHKRRVVDKMPSNFEFAALIHLMLPNARIIHCSRDPVDTCLSCYARHFAGPQNFAYDLRELGLRYRAYERLMSSWRALLPPERYIEVRYEDVVDDLETQALRMVGFCGLAWNRACLSFHKSRRPVRTASFNQVRRPLYRTSIERWRSYVGHLEPLLAALEE